MELTKVTKVLQDLILEYTYPLYSWFQKGINKDCAPHKLTYITEIWLESAIIGEDDKGNLTENHFGDLPFDGYTDEEVEDTITIQRCEGQDDCSFGKDVWCGYEMNQMDFYHMSRKRNYSSGFGPSKSFQKSMETEDFTSLHDVLDKVTTLGNGSGY
jgi:hypothetical protein